MTDDYEPELGQMLFGHRSQRFECPAFLEAALTLLRQEVERVMWNVFQEEHDPFGNRSDSADFGNIIICSYYWGDDRDQLWNFCYPKGNLAVSWYKYFPRGLSVNREVEPAEIAKFLVDWLQIVRSASQHVGARKAQQKIKIPGLEPSLSGVN